MKKINFETKKKTILRQKKEKKTDVFGHEKLPYGPGKVMKILK